MPDVLVLKPDYLLAWPSRSQLIKGGGVAVSGDRILEVADPALLTARWPAAEVIDLPDCLLTPGLVNAHHHGRGLSQLQLGYRDMPLETWLIQRRGRGLFDPYPLARLTALNMLANGVTTSLQANFTFGSGDYEAELRAQIRAYDETGVRMTLSVGAMDRGYLAYPPHEACFMAGLPDDLRRWIAKPGAPPYAGDGAATVALMGRLLEDFANHPRIRFCYGPAGPQWVSDELFAAMARDAADKGLGINMHALESPVQRRAMNELYPGGVFHHLEKLGVMTGRTVIAHCVWADEADAEVLARTGATVVRNPGCNLRLSSGVAPMSRYLAQGVRMAIGTDNHSLNDDEDLLAELRLAGCLARDPDWSGPPPPGVDDLLAMATTNGAVAAQWSGEAGAVAPGFRADLAAFCLKRTREPLLDEDTPLLEAFLGRAAGRDCRLTMVGGKVLYRDGRFTHPGLYELAQEAALATARAARLSIDPENRDRAQRLRGPLSAHFKGYMAGLLDS